LLKLFYNYQERRLRAAWRLALQFLVFSLVGLLVSFVFSAVASLVLVMRPGSPQDSASLASALLRSNFFRTAMGIGTLLAILVSYWVASRWLDHRPMRAFGFHFSRHWWLDFLFGLGLGALLMLCIFLAELALGWVQVTGTFFSADPQVPFGLGLLSNGLLFFCVGIYEEMLSRGYHLRNLAEGLNFPFPGPRAALVTAYLGSSAMFGLAHYSNPYSSWISTLNLVVAGLFLGLGFILTGELALSIGLHMSWNFFQGNVFGFPVSGLVADASFITIQQHGPELVTGGSFGPEAGLIGLAAIVLGSLLILLWVHRRVGRISFQTKLAEYPRADG